MLVSYISVSIYTAFDTIFIILAAVEVGHIAGGLTALIFAVIIFVVIVIAIYYLR